MRLLIGATVVAVLALGWSLLSPRGAVLDARLFEAINSRPLPLLLEIAVRLISHLGLLPTNLLIWGTIWLAVHNRRGLAGGTGLLMAWAACRVLKATTGRARPYQALEGARLVGLEPSGSSFPSSHAALAVYTAVTASHLLGADPLLTAVAYGLAAVVCYARIYLGAHYPRDVLMGVVIGLVAAVGVGAFGPTGRGWRPAPAARRRVHR